MSKPEEIVLPKRVIPQPDPFICPIGDCGGCVLSGLTGLSIDEIYDQDISEKEHVRSHGISRSRMGNYLYHFKHMELFDRIVRDVPFWFPYEQMTQFGAPSTMFNGKWFSYIRMAMDAGYYALAEVDHDKQGGPTNHWVLLCGNRSYTEWNEAGTCGTVHNQILVSCSSRATPAEEWVDALDFLKNRGGFNAYLVRPK